MKKSTNLQFTRFVAAVMVIFSHSFPIVAETKSKEWMICWTNSQISFGGVAVALFFLCSGYLCVNSIKNNSIVASVSKRIRRIVPPLICVVIISIVVGASISSLGISEYFRNIMTYKYLLNGIFILQHELPGVFSNTPFTRTVNGALWTLPVEMLCFCVTCIINKLHLLKVDKVKYTLPIFVLLVFISFYLKKQYPIIETIMVPCFMYYQGIVYYIYREKIRYSMRNTVIAMLILLCSVWINCMMIGLVLTLPYIMIYFWFSAKQYFGRIYKLGNISYSMYLWGFPIQQYVGYRAEWRMSAYTNFAISIVIDIFVGYMTYVIIEKKYFLRRKKNEFNK